MILTTMTDATETTTEATTEKPTETTTNMSEEEMKKGEELVEEIRRKNAEFAAAKRAKDDAEWAEWSMYDPEVHSVADAEQLLGEKGVRPGEGPGAWMLVLEPGEASVAKTPAAERMEAALVPEPGDKITFRMQEFLGLHFEEGVLHTHSLWARTPQIGFHMKNMHFFSHPRNSGRT